jgi:hypothetical protein
MRSFGKGSFVAKKGENIVLVKRDQNVKGKKRVGV